MQRNITQSKEALLKSYNTRLKEDVRSMLENFEEIVRLAKGENETQLSKMTQCEQDTYEMQVRASNIVRAGESLMKLVSDIKQYLILNDFHSVNDAICSSSQLYRSTQMDRDNKLMMVRDDMAADLYDLEEEYYTTQAQISANVSLTLVQIRHHVQIQSHRLLLHERPTVQATAQGDHRAEQARGEPGRGADQPVALLQWLRRLHPVWGGSPLGARNSRRVGVRGGAAGSVLPAGAVREGVSGLRQH